MEPRKTKAQLDREIAAALQHETSTIGSGNGPRGPRRTGAPWQVEAGRGLVYQGYLAFNLHRHIDQGGNSIISPVELDEIAHDVARMLNRSKRKLRAVR